MNNKSIKQQILFIDFEAITPNFLHRIPKYSKIKHEIIYCFTLGKVINKDKTIFKTYFLDLSNFSLQAYNERLTKLLKDATKEFVGKNTEINNQNVNFIGWNAELEKRITTKYLKITTKSIDYHHHSLDNVASQIGYQQTDPFVDLNKTNIKAPENEKKGKLAAYLGFVLLSYYNNKESLIGNINNDDILLIKDMIQKYNQTDVEQTIFILKNLNKANKVIDELTQKRLVITKLASQIQNSRKNIELLKSDLGQKNINTDVNKYILNLEAWIVKNEAKEKEINNQEKQKIVEHIIKQKTNLINFLTKEKNCKTLKNIIIKYQNKINDDEQKLTKLREQFQNQAYSKKPIKRKMMKK